MPDNIQFSKKNMSISNNYFYMFDEEVNLLFKKTDDGTVAFSYPLDTPLENEVINTEFDGVNFWSLENLNPENDDGESYDVVVKRWAIENYTCKLKTTLNFIENVGHAYSVNSFSIENYCLTISGTCIPGDKVIPVSGGYGSKIGSGMTATLGPNVDGYFETVAVSTASDGFVTLADGITYTYNIGHNLRFYSFLWLFNNFDGVDHTSSALYKMNAYSGTYLLKYTGGEYGGITASKFLTTDKFFEYGTVSSLAFVKGTNLLFINIEELGTMFSIYRSMVIDNLLVNTGTVIAVNDIDIVGDNIYKLQQQGSKFGQPVSFTHGGNYMIEPFQPFVTSVLLSSDPGVIAANNSSTTSLKAKVLDQYNLPIFGRSILFTIDVIGDYVPCFITGTNPVNTDVNGEAITIITAGNETGWASIIGTMDQS